MASMQITLSIVADAARQRLAAVTAEVAGYVVFLAARQLASKPRHVWAGLVTLSDAGDVNVRESSEATPLEVEVELRQLLATLIALAPSPPPALKAAVEREASGAVIGLEQELAAALIPLNHSAARRALARLYRETCKASGAQHPDGRELTPSPPPAGVKPARHAETEAVARRSVDARSGGSYLTPSLVGGEEEKDELDIEIDVIEAAESAPPPPLPLASMAPGAPAFEHRDEFALTSGAASMSPPSPATPSVSCLGSEDASPPSIEPVSHHSDLSELLSNFLAHTRCEERMTEDLRRMVGLDDVQLRAASAPVEAIRPLRPGAHA